MPELVEVEIMGRNLARWLEGHRVIRVEVARPASVRPPDAWREVERALVGEVAIQVRRRGKALWVGPVPGRGVILRFGMTGKVVREVRPGDRPDARVRWLLERVDGGEGGAVAFLDGRNLGSIRPATVGSAEGLEALLVAEVPGRDAWLDPPDGPALLAALGAGRRPVKVALLDQAGIAGIGNILATEALFEAGIDPRAAVGALTADGAARLARALPTVIGRYLALEDADEIRYLSEGAVVNPFRIYGRGGAPCPCCGEVLARASLGGRGTVWCPRCQPPAGRLEGLGEAPRSP